MSTSTLPPTLPVAVLPNGNVQMGSGAIIDGSLIDATSKAANSNSTPVQQMGNKTLLSNGNTIVAGSDSMPAIPQAVVANKSGVIMSNGSTVHANHLNALPPISGTSVADAAASANSTRANGLSQSQASQDLKSHAHQIAAISSNHASNAHRTYGNQASAARHAEIAAKHLWLAQQSISNQEYYTKKREGFDPNSGGCNIAPPHPMTQYCKAAPFNSVTGAKYFYVGEAYGVPTST